MPRKTNTQINGNDYFRVRAVVGTKPDGSTIIKAFYGKTKKEAEEQRDEYMHSIKNGLAIGFDKLTVGDAFCKWFDTVHVPTLAVSSIDRYSYDSKRIYSSMLAGMKIMEVKSLHIQSFYDDLLKAGATVDTVRNTNKLLSKFFAYATKTDLIIKNPMLAVELPVDRDIKPDKKILKMDELRKIMVYARDNDSAFIFVFLALTGLREGEALALTHNDIDFEDGFIRVSKSLNHLHIDGKYQAIVSIPKTKGSKRDVPILDGLRPMLKVHITAEKEKHLRLGVRFSNENIFFTSEAGGYIEAKNLRIRFKRLLKRLDIEPVVVHSLRHLFCTYLAERGVNLKTASVLMGHANINTTQKVYIQVQQEEKKRGIAALSDVLI